MAKKLELMVSEAPSREGRRVYVSQSEMPARTLREALRVAHAIADNFGKTPTKPLLVAEALGMSPTSGTYRMLCGASLGYGLTEGGYNANVISLTPLGLRAVAPQRENEDIEAMREAFLRPRVVREFLTKYHNSKLPPDRIATNVLEGMGVPPDASSRVFDVISKGAQELGLLRDIKGQTYVDIESASPSMPETDSSGSSQQSQTEAPSNPVSAAATSRFAHHSGSRPSSGFDSIPLQSDSRSFNIPLSGGRVGSILLPTPVEGADLERIKKWLEIMEDVLTEPIPVQQKHAEGSSAAASLSLLQSVHEQ